MILNKDTIILGRVVCTYFLIVCQKLKWIAVWDDLQETFLDSGRILTLKLSSQTISKRPIEVKEEPLFHDKLVHARPQEGDNYQKVNFWGHVAKYSDPGELTKQSSDRESADLLNFHGEISERLWTHRTHFAALQIVMNT